jgi:sugar lactone lactonase YvrE
MALGEAFATELFFPECPRWRDGHLWASDMWDNTVYRFDVDTGARHVVHEFDDEPGGLGWLPDGRLLVVSMEHRLLLRLEDDGPVVHADLRPFAAWSCNDMIVTDDGTAYVSQFGFDLWGGTTPMTPAPVLRVTADGDVSVAAEDLMCPNGMALVPGDRTLFVAEPAASRITSFDVEADGRLSNRAVFAQVPAKEGLPAAPPDGICLDRDGAVWMAEPLGKRVLRVNRGGEIVEEIPFDFHPTAVALGGEDRRTLFVCLAPHIDHGRPRDTPGARIDAVRVGAPGMGKP